MSDSTRKRRSRKATERPKKPYPEFLFSPHPSGAWQKKIRGKIHYFGRWAKCVNGKLVRIDGDGWKDLYVMDPEFKAIEMICAMTRKAGDRAALVDLRDIAASLRTIP